MKLLVCSFFFFFEVRQNTSKWKYHCCLFIVCLLAMFWKTKCFISRHITIWQLFLRPINAWTKGIDFFRLTRTFPDCTLVSEVLFTVRVSIAKIDTFRAEKTHKIISQHILSRWSSIILIKSNGSFLFSYFSQKKERKAEILLRRKFECEKNSYKWNHS